MCHHFLVLRVSAMRDEETGGIRYTVVDGSAAGPQEHLAKVAGFGNRLLEENGLLGTFSSPEAGVLLLQVTVSDRTFFHEGIVFAALDAFNEPTRNVTITQPSIGDDDGGPRD
jgi:hypothetical protein